MTMPKICRGCGQLIIGYTVWLGEDYRSEGGDIQGPYPFHSPCADAPWPLYELTESEAEALENEKSIIVKAGS